jgi:hypothetical protein
VLVVLNSVELNVGCGGIIVVVVEMIVVGIVVVVVEVVVDEVVLVVVIGQDIDSDLQHISIPGSNGLSQVLPAVLSKQSGGIKSSTHSSQQL